MLYFIFQPHLRMKVYQRKQRYLKLDVQFTQSNEAKYRQVLFEDQFHLKINVY